VPLIVASGAGAAARKSIGITVFSGMLASTVFALALVPVFFVLVGRLQERLTRPDRASSAPGLGASS
jgi:HAE1 family hydrophobic/amphiphilic exporter-1